jgi:hypothetical protein
MRTRLFQALLLALAVILFASACSSDSESTDTDAETSDAETDGSDSASSETEDVSGDASDDASDDSSAADESTDTSEAAADTGGGDGGEGADCLIGTWEAPQEVVEEQVLGNLAGVPAEIELISGSVTAEFRADQTADFVTQAEVLVTVPDFGEHEGTMDGLNSVDWSVVGNVMTFTTTDFNLDMAVDGYPFPEVSGPAPGDSATLVFSCSGDVLELTNDNLLAPIPARLNRVG